MLEMTIIQGRIKNWLRTPSTIEFLGFWEKINNPNFKGVEFDSFNRLLKNVFEAADARQKQAKKRSLCLINEHFEPVFNTAAATQIVFQRPVKSEAGTNNFTLSPNLESINAELIQQGVAQTDRITALNQIAIHQMRSLLGAPEIKKLK